MQFTKDDLEIKVAHILGISELVEGKEYDNNDVFDLLEVTNEKLMKYYEYLKQHLTFPFRATYEQETGFLMTEDYEVNCLRLDREMEADEFYGILMECRYGRKKVIIDLAEMDVDKKHRNFPFVDLYQGWFCNYR